MALSGKGSVDTVDNLPYCKTLKLLYISTVMTGHVLPKFRQNGPSVKDLPQEWRERVNIYFIGIEGDPTAIKIGRTKDAVEKRLAALQTGHYRQYEILASIRLPSHSECLIHRALKADHIRGEWFRRSEKLERIIDLAKAERHFCLMAEINADVKLE